MPVDGNRAIEVPLAVDLTVPAAPKAAVEGWRTVQTGGFAPAEEELALWQGGGLAGLPNLEGLS